ncbi:hypothetical protein AO501_10720 [Mycobacterium gordonae]|uniref:DUF732 domain-containing protein n=1 Tax=Mycobacterium gordonae TaxID=1778 RepID=A0A0Q2X6M8_MYCGO|nr:MULTISPECIES: hypothetical protein [Mycobacterium]KQH76948.1 hypothetical protein AO501_10720 [Mycobacterium gordonae]MDP7728219.1 hypothetical protein [Mycobacterium sp. TY813]
MGKRWWIAAVAIAATVLTGCSSGKTTVVHSSGASSPGKSTSPAASSSSEATTTESAPVSTLDSSQCVDVTGANLDLLTASDKDAARKAADTLERYNPPSSVKSAIEHFVSTGGAHFDDPDYTKNNQIVKSWVDQVCPT